MTTQDDIKTTLWEGMRDLWLAGLQAEMDKCPTPGRKDQVEADADSDWEDLAGLHASVYPLLEAEWQASDQSVQDQVTDHETRIQTLEVTIDDHEDRITTNEGNTATLQIADFSFRAFTGSNVINANDVVVEVTRSGTTTVTLPALSGVGTGKVYFVLCTGIGLLQNITFDGNAAETINGSATFVVSSNGGFTLVRGTSEWFAF